jgi:hypothetical protein
LRDAAAEAGAGEAASSRGGSAAPRPALDEPRVAARRKCHYCSVEQMVYERTFPGWRELCALPTSDGGA